VNVVIANFNTNMRKMTKTSQQKNGLEVKEVISTQV